MLEEYAGSKSRFVKVEKQLLKFGVLAKLKDAS
jgi:hypothetical protein